MNWQIYNWHYVLRGNLKLRLYYVNFDCQFLTSISTFKLIHNFGHWNKMLHWHSGVYIYQVLVDTITLQYLVYPRIRSFAPSKILSIRRVPSTVSVPLRMTKSTSLPRICGPITSKESASFISRYSRLILMFKPPDCA